MLFIGDGLGVNTYTAARLWKVGATGRLRIDSLPYTALAATHSFDNIVTDSAAAATAMMSGVKTRNGVLGEGPDAFPGSAADPASGREGTPVETLAERAAERGWATGVVTTTRVTHATPAACYAHVHHRDLEQDIAAQLLEPRFGNPPPEVILGGGRAMFLPASAADPEYPAQHGGRADGRDLLAAMRQRGYVVVWNESQFAAVDAAATERLLGLFEPSHMHFESERAGDAGGEPSLAEMTEKAIRVLARNPLGYFLMVEGGRIDHGLHMNNVELALSETAAFDDAVARALELTNPAETLVIVTADHSHPLTISGYPAIGRDGESGGENAAETRRNLLGAGGLDLNDKPYPVLSFANGPGALHPRPPTADRPALVPLESSTHAGEDVFVAARGPGAARLHGFIDDTQIYDLMRRALGL